jgi:hypothetical protein
VRRPLTRTGADHLSRCLLLASCASLVAGAAQAAPPTGWILAGEPREDYDVGVERGALPSGKSGAFIRGRGPSPRGFGTLMQTFAATNYRGKRVRLSVLVRSANVRGWAGLWMRIDCPDAEVCAFDNMQNRPIKGTVSWKRHEVVLDVAPEAVAIAFGVLQSGAGQTWIGELKLEVVDRTVPTTNLEHNGLEQQPTNLDFSR